MTISSSSGRIQYNGNGATTAFATNFKLLASTHVKVILTDALGVDTVQTETTHYTVSNIGSNPSTVTMVTAPASGEKLTLILNVPLTQDTDLVNGQSFDADVVEQSLDLGVQIDQVLNEKFTRSLQVPETVSTSFDGTLPSVTADYIVRIDSAGTGFETVSAVDAGLSGALTPTSGNVIQGNGTDWVSVSALTALSVTGDITVGGNVDGVDIAALKADVDGFPDELKNLTAAEIGELENIDSTTISTTQWGYLGSQDQSLTTADNVSFVNGDFTGTESLKVPAGTTAQRPGSPVDGDLRVNTTLAQMEVFRNTAWRSLESGGGTMTAVIDDTTPQLGGDLDVNGFQITSPDGTDLIDLPDGSIDLQTATTSRLDITDSGVRLGGANARVTTVLDQDAMSSNSATALVTQQSVKAYVDSGTTTLTNKTIDANSNAISNLPYDLGFVAGYDAAMAATDLVVQTYGEVVMTRTGSILGESGYLETQATGAVAIVDIEKNGTSVYVTKPQFAVSTSTLTAGTVKSDGTEDFVAGDRLTFKVTQIGSTIAGGRMRFTVKAEV